jgi:hypothetical protein
VRAVGMFKGLRLKEDFLTDENTDFHTGLGILFIDKLKSIAESLDLLPNPSIIRYNRMVERE